MMACLITSRCLMTCLTTSVPGAALFQHLDVLPSGLMAYRTACVLVYYLMASKTSLCLDVFLTSWREERSVSGVLSDGMKNGAQDPTVVLDEYGADALRLYLINSPVVRGETLRFNKEGVFAVVKDVFLPWYNAYRFLVQNVLRLQQQTGIAFEPTKVTLLICLCTLPCKRQTQSLLAVSKPACSTTHCCPPSSCHAVKLVYLSCLACCLT